MGPEPVMGLVLLGSLCVCLVRLGLNLWRRNWRVAAAIVAGTGLGLAPWFAFGGPAVWTPLVVVTAAGALALAVSAALRAKRFQLICGSVLAAAIGLMVADDALGLSRFAALWESVAFVGLLSAPGWTAAGAVAVLALAGPPRALDAAPTHP